MTTASTELLSYCKTSLRLTSTVFDDEVNQLIATAIADINQSTDKTFDESDKVQCQAVALYCQAHFGYGDEKQERRYQQMLQRIGLRKIKYIDEVVE